MFKETNIACLPKEEYHIESTEVSNWGFGKSPDNKTRISYVKNVVKFRSLKRYYQIITADGMAKHRNSLMLVKTSPENVTRVFSHALE